MINATFRPLDDWPGQLRRQSERLPSQFKASWQSTLDLLDHELRMLDSAAVVVKLALTDRDIRRDGWPRKDARSPHHPGVVIEFETRRHGWLRYFDDQYTTWQDNLRALALSLEALRALNRWGALSGEQYVGSRLELEAGSPRLPPVGEGLADEVNGGGSVRDSVTPQPPMKRPEALSFLKEHSGYLLESADRPELERAYRRAAIKLHPDRGGDSADFARLQEARSLLLPPERSAPR